MLLSQQQLDLKRKGGYDKQGDEARHGKGYGDFCKGCQRVPRTIVKAAKAQLQFKGQLIAFNADDSFLI